MQHFFKLHCYEIPDRWWKRGCYSAICPHLGVSQMLFRLSAVIFLCSKNLLGDDPMCHSKHAMFLTLSHHPRPSSSQVWQRRVSPCHRCLGRRFATAPAAWYRSCKGHGHPGHQKGHQRLIPLAGSKTCCRDWMWKDMEKVAELGVPVYQCFPKSNDIFQVPAVKQFQDAQRKAACCVCQI